MEQQRVRISDIAEELGLSTATVSNVIHGKTAKISDETVKRVQALLEERQYIPSMAGILLAQNSSKIIGIFVNDHEKYEHHVLDDAFIASSLNCLSEEIEARGLFMMVKKAKNPEEIIQFASMWNMDGLVVIGFCYQDYMYLRNHMRIPFVVYDGFCDKTERIVDITIDNFDGGLQVGEMFKRNGHKNALCISDNIIGVDLERMEGFKKGFGAEHTEVMVVPMTKVERWEHYRKHLDDFRRVSAVFAVSDYYAIDFIHFINEQGISVPNDISVAGFDDIPMCEMITPTLTTVRQDGALRAKTAIEKLYELKENGDVGTTIRLPVQLIERASTRQYK
ncbi:MAG: LacI family DNA-binding transcriptional regulator [Lachnospiraceae bacterium]